MTEMPYLANAACIGTEPRATLCERCWDRPECLAWALESEPDGFWGGYTAAARVTLRHTFGIPRPKRRR